MINGNCENSIAYVRARTRDLCLYDVLFVCLFVYIFFCSFPLFLHIFSPLFSTYAPILSFAFIILPNLLHTHTAILERRNPLKLCTSNRRILKRSFNENFSPLFFLPIHPRNAIKLIRQLFTSPFRFMTCFWILL